MIEDVTTIFTLAAFAIAFPFISVVKAAALFVRLVDKTERWSDAWRAASVGLAVCATAAVVTLGAKAILGSAASIPPLTITHVESAFVFVRWGVVVGELYLLVLVASILPTLAVVLVSKEDT